MTTFRKRRDSESLPSTFRNRRDNESIPSWIDRLFEGTDESTINVIKKVAKEAWIDGLKFEREVNKNIN